jgi:hypothetical protein
MVSVVEIEMARAPVTSPGARPLGRAPETESKRGILDCCLGQPTSSPSRPGPMPRRSNDRLRNGVIVCQNGRVMEHPDQILVVT